MSAEVGRRLYFRNTPVRNAPYDLAGPSLVTHKRHQRRVCRCCAVSCKMLHVGRRLERIDNALVGVRTFELRQSTAVEQGETLQLSAGLQCGNDVPTNGPGCAQHYDLKRQRCWRQLRGGSQRFESAI